MSGNDDLFSHAMRGVRKLQSEPHHQANKPRPQSRGTTEVEHPSSAGLEGLRPEKSEEPWVLKADGISQERLRQLTNGRPPVDMEVDLHGMTREEALAALDHCMQRALTEHHRVLCLVHGRGLHSQDGRPVLKESVYRWLAEGPFAGHVLAAIPKPGTRGGSCLVLLRRKR
ncbi:MAG: Smr/MutS family protein [Mariprofundaceae bacterium]|nr:Smr/MutS family protein [Mariprofundaceae bacterium]